MRRGHRGRLSFLHRPLAGMPGGCLSRGARPSYLLLPHSMSLPTPTLQLSAEMRKRLPPLGTCDSQPNPVAQVKFFTPDAHWTWYAFEFDGEDAFFGFVEGDFPELGYFSLAELQSVRGRLGLPVEVDRSFEPTPLSTLMK